MVHLRHCPSTLQAAILCAALCAPLGIAPPAAAQAAAKVPVVQQEQRLALVIGNAAYKDAPLRNAANDARAIAAVLKEAGFTVQLQTDADHRSMASALRAFGDQLRKGGGVGVFYFAGHGMQIRGRNYLVPVGADIQREDEVAYNALDAQAVLDKMEAAGNGTNLMILDACRNNPFARSFRSSAQGLAQMDAPVGSLVAFATAPGSVASDGPDANGLYTQHLLRAMRQRGAKIEDVFKQVRSAVRRESQGQQVPWEATSLEGDLYIFPPALAAAPVAVAPAPLPLPSPASSPAPTPARPASALASARLATAQVPPAGPPSEERERRTAQLLAELARPAASPVLRPRPAALPASNVHGFTVGDVWNYQVVDRWRGEVVRNYAQRVQKIESDGSWVSASGDRQDALGRTTRYRGNDGLPRQITPHAPRWWPDMKPGERRRFDWEEAATRADGSAALNRHEGEVHFVGVETVKVPAGEFQAQRFEYKGVNTAVGASGRGTLAMVAWFVPALHTMVALDRESIWNGKLELRDRAELTSYTLAGVKTP